MEALEVKVAFQEHLLAELDDVLRLVRDKVERLEAQVAGLEASRASQQIEDAPPPHY